MKISNIWRLLRILLIFSRKKRVKAKEIAADIEISVRQVYRDIECLKLAGIPIYSDRNGFVLMPDFFMPAISLETPEVLTLFLICASLKAQKGTPYYELLNSACDKILNALPDSLKTLFNTTGFDVNVDFGLDSKIDYEKIDEIFSSVYQASIAKKQILIKYYSMDGKKVTVRIIDPYAFKLYFGIWYLIGFCHLRKEIRTFRVDRIRNVEILEHGFLYPEDFDIESYFEGSWGIIKGKKQKVRLRFCAEVSDFISECIWHPSQIFSRNADGSLTAEYEISGLSEIKIWILGFGENVEVLEPASLRKEMLDTLFKMQNNYCKS